MVILKHTSSSINALVHFANNPVSKDKNQLQIVDLKTTKPQKESAKACIGTPIVEKHDLA